MDAVTQSYAPRQTGSFAEHVRCLECGRPYLKPLRGSISATNPGCPRCGYVGWVPVTREQRQPAPARVRGCAGCADDARAAEVVVPRRPAAHRRSPRPRAARGPSSSTPGSAWTSRPAGWTRGAIDRLLRRRGPRRGCRRGRRRARCAAAFPRLRRRRARAAPSCDRRARRHHALPSAAPGSSGPRRRSVSPSIEFRCRSRPGRKSPEPRPRLVVIAQPFPSASTATRFVVWRLRAVAARARARARRRARPARQSREPRERGERRAGPARARRASRAASRSSRAPRARARRARSAARSSRGQRTAALVAQREERCVELVRRRAQAPSTSPGWRRRSPVLEQRRRPARRSRRRPAV